VLQFFHDNPNLRVAVLNADDAGVAKVLAKLELPSGAQLRTFGFGPGADVRGCNVETRRMAASFDVEVRQQDGSYLRLGRVHTALPGKYNASNLLGGIATALAIGVPFADIERAVPGYKGLENRFTLVDAAGVEVVKDYISHPTGIARVLEAAKEQSEGPVIAVFKPYRFTMIHYLQDDYREAFKLADRVLVTELYTAGEVPIPGTDVHTLCAKIRESVPDVTYVHALDDIPGWLQQEVQAPATVLFFGGDDLFQMANRYAELRNSAA
jgi:UDP-N-acetylmuramate--alanine ligase